MNLLWLLVVECIVCAALCPLWLAMAFALFAIVFTAFALWGPHPDDL